MGYLLSDPGLIGSPGQSKTRCAEWINFWFPDLSLSMSTFSLRKLGPELQKTCGTGTHTHTQITKLSAKIGKRVLFILGLCVAMG